MPSTTRAVPVHLSYDPKSDRIAYPNGKSIYLRSVARPGEVLQFTSHNYPTTVAKFSPSGFYVASGDESGNVKVWDTVGEDHIVKGDFPVIGGRINDLAWDADSKRIIAVGNSNERFGHCFTFDSGNSVGEISGHSAQISAVTIKPTRPFRAATVGDDSSLVFLSAPPYKFISSIRDKHTNFVRDVAYSTDGNYIVSVGSDRKIVVYDGKSGEYVKNISDVNLKPNEAHEGGVFSVSWLLDNPKHFVTASADASVKLWDVESGELLQTWKLPKSVENQQLGVVATKDYIVSLSFNGNLNYFTKETQTEPVRIIKGHQKSITSLTVNDNGLYTGSADGRIVQWGLKQREGTANYISGKGHSNLIGDLVSDAKSSVFSSGWDDKISKTNNLEFDESHELKLESQPVKVSSVNSSGIYGLVTSDSNLTLVDSLTGKTTVKKLDYEASSIDVNDELVIVGDDKSFNINFYSVDDLSPVSGHSLKTNYKPTHIKISPNSQYAAIGDSSGKIVLYNIADKVIQTSRWAFHTARINSISWTTDSKYVASGSLDTNIIIYSVEKPIRNIKALNAHKDGVNAVAWVNNNEVISVGSDSAIKIWDVTFQN